MIVMTITATTPELKIIIILIIITDNNGNVHFCYLSLGKSGFLKLVKRNNVICLFNIFMI